MEGLYGNSITGICELCWEDCGECVETIVDGVSEPTVLYVLEIYSLTKTTVV
jgi:hypothetical protein